MEHRLGFLLFLIFLTVSCDPIAFDFNDDVDLFQPTVNHDDEKSIDYWMKEGRQFLEEKIAFHSKYFGVDASKNKKIAKNIVFFIGDGMGISSITAGRIYVGSKRNQSIPEKGPLSFDSFPFTSLLKTYTINTQVGDSASAATAITSGVKTQFNTAGLSGRVGEDDHSCSRITQEDKTTSFLKWAQDSGKATGLVTTTRVTHATPSALYAHLPSRQWESSAPQGCKDVTQQLVYESPGRDIRLIFGGGWQTFTPKSLHKLGNRTDDVDMIMEWGMDKVMRDKTAIYLNSTKDFDREDINKYDYCLGLFNDNHLMYETSRMKNRSEPALHELVTKALSFLKNKSDDSGYLLFVEGGKIDLAHHKNWAVRAMEEIRAFDVAVQAALDIIDLEDTLVIVTADHSHGMTYNGYSERGTSVFGIPGVDSSGISYSAMQYSSGPGHQEVRVNVTLNQTMDEDYKYNAAIYKDDIAVHSGEDVALFATGLGSHYFTGSYDQAMVAHLLSYATCIGPHKELCPTDQEIQDIFNDITEEPSSASSSPSSSASHGALVSAAISVLAWFKSLF